MDQHRTPRLILISCLFMFSLLKSSPGQVINIHATGASHIENGAARKALETAKANALKKVFESQLNKLVLLTAQERQVMLQTLLNQQEQFVMDVQTVKETTHDKMVRVVLEGQLLSEPLLRILIDAGFLSRFKQKPRLVIGFNEQHQNKLNPNRPFAALLGEKLATLNIPVLPARLPTDLTKLSDTNLVKIAHEAGGDMVIAGEVSTEMLKVGNIGMYKSCRAELSIRALRTDTGEILSTMEWGGAGLGVSETAAIKEAFRHLPPDKIDSFAENFLIKWLIGVAKQEVALNDTTVGTPPRIQIDFPLDGEVIDTDSIRLQGYAADDKGIRNILLSVNGTELPLTSVHLSVPPDATSPETEESNAYQISRLIPLHQGKNVIRLEVQDTDNNRVEATLVLLRLAPFTESESSGDEANTGVVLELDTPKDGQIVTSESVTLRGRVKGDQQVTKIRVLVNESEIFTPVKALVVEGVSGDFAFQRQIWLAPGDNRIEVIVRMDDGGVAKRELTVTRRRETSVKPNIENAPQRYAVIVSIGNYQDARIPKLRFTRADAESFYQYLIDPDRGGFSSENVRLLIDEQATLKNLRSTIGTWLAERAKPEDTVILYYSGHGGLGADLSGEAVDGKNRYLINYDADPDDLYATSLPNPELALMLARIQSQKLVFFLDCCYSGGTASGNGIIKSFNPSASVVKSDVYAPFAGQGRAVISASRADQVSYEIPELQHGIFTYHLLRGLNGEADRDGDGAITLFELYPYLVKAVGETAKTVLGVSQTPTLMGHIEGDLILKARK